MMRILLTLLVLFLFANQIAFAQSCGSAQGDQVTYGNGNWIGYVYDGIANFNSADYQGYYTENEIFDQSFCGDNCTFSINGCDIQTEEFTVRYKMEKYFTCGTYKITIGGDDGVRLSLDGGSTYILGNFNQHSFTTYTEYVYLEEGTHNIIFDYYEAYTNNRVSFNYEFLGSNYGGEVSGDYQTCGEVTIDPDAFQSISSAAFCTMSTELNYQWQVSTDQTNWSDISGATGTTYDIAAGYSGTHYYRRKADDGAGTEAYSNTLTVAAQLPQGDEVSYGDNSWIGYVYDDMNNYTNYSGEIFESEKFTEDFGTNDGTFSTSGCDVSAQTFTVRFKMRKTFDCGEYTFTVGGDDGFRLSIDGGNNFIIDRYYDHGYMTQPSASMSLEGTYDLVLEYYENGGSNTVSFDYVQSGNCTLPVVLNYFEGKQDDNKVKLLWETSVEVNNDFFSIERSTDGRNFEAIDTIKGNGNFTQKVEYSFKDKSPVNGVNYYRLKQVDYDGSYEYSPIISVFVSFKELLQLLPNPAAQYFSISYPNSSDSEGFYSITDLFGNVLQSGSTNPSALDKAIRINDLKDGIYLVRFRIDHKEIREQLIVKR